MMMMMMMMMMMASTLLRDGVSLHRCVSLILLHSILFGIFFALKQEYSLLGQPIVNSQSAAKGQQLTHLALLFPQLFRDYPSIHLSTIW
jgi:hypothetical protein